jgi:zinc protease
VSSKAIPSVNVTEWTLSNGVRVLVKPTDFKADEVLFNASSPGGSSLAPDADYMSAGFASQIVGLSGLGQFNRIDLQKKLSGKVASAGASIGGTSEGLTGRASPKDHETMFQLIYLDFTAPRFDPAAYAAFKAQADQYLANRGSDPDEVFGGTLSWTMASHNLRARPLSAATFAEVNRKALAFYKRRFADASTSRSHLSNVDTLTLKPLVEVSRHAADSAEGDVPRRRQSAEGHRRRVRKGVGRANTVIELRARVSTRRRRNSTRRWPSCFKSS